MTQKLKGWSLMLVAAMLFSLWPSLYASAEGDEVSTMPEILFKYTGDAKDDNAFTALNGVTSTVVDDETHNMVLKMEEASSFLVNTKRELTKGNVVISWDYKADKFNESYARIYSVGLTGTQAPQGKWYDTLIYRTGGQIQSFKQLYNWQLDTLQATNYKANEWHHVDLWLNLDEKVMDYYVNGKLMGTQTVYETFDKFCCFSMAHVAKGIGADVRFDNIYVGYAPKNGYKTGFDFCEYIPPEIETPVNTELIIDKIGHAFFDENANIKVKFANAHETSKEMTASLKVYTQSGKLKYETTDDFTISGNEIKEQEYKFKLDEFAVYNVYFKLTDKKSGEVVEKTTRISRLNGPPDGVFNEQMGLNNHFQNGRGMDRYDEVLDMFADAGFKHIRESCNWDWFEKNPGVYEFPYPHNLFIPKIYENGQKNFVTVGTRTWLYNKEEIPVSDSEIGHWRDYVENLAIQHKQYGNKDFEIGNELNLVYNAGRLTAEQYVRLLKEAYPVIKKHIPDARVYAFCTANVQPYKFIRECMDLGAADYFDGISIHPYQVLGRPEETEYFNDIKGIKDLMKEYGIEDKSLVYSEYGWTSAPQFVSEDEQARYSVRSSALSYDWMDMNIWYVSIEKVDLTSLSELHFGMLRGWTGQEINYEPKPVYRAMSNYNAIMAETESNGQQKILDDGGYICKFKDKAGQDIYMIWKVRDTADLTLDIGAEGAVLVDMYGNETEVKAENNTVQLAVSEDPIYLIGNFSKCEEIKDAEQIKVLEKTVETTLSDSAEINIFGGKDKYSIEPELPENITLSGEAKFTNGRASVKFITGSNPQTAEQIKINVKNQEGDIVYTKTLDVNYSTSASYDFTVKYYKSGRWQGALKITNNKTENPITGTFVVKEPEEITKSVGTQSIGNIAPKQTELLMFNIPKEISSGNLDIRGVLKLSTGEEINIESTTYFTSLMPIPKEPKIDGKIEVGEYNTNAPVRIDKDYMVQQITEWGGVNDASATAYINYDKDYFYLAAVATDNVLGDNDEQKRIWANDSIQFAFANENVSGSKITEIGIGLVNGVPSIERYSFMGTKENIMFLEAEEKEGFNKDTELQIVRSGNKTYYELKLSWEDIYATADDFNRKNIYFSIILNDNDGSGRRGWLEFCPGIGGSKNAMLFSKVAVGKK